MIHHEACTVVVIFINLHTQDEANFLATMYRHTAKCVTMTYPIEIDNIGSKVKVTVTKNVCLNDEKS